MPTAPHPESGLTRSFAKPPLRGGLQPVRGPVAAAVGTKIHDPCLDDGAWGAYIERALDGDGFALYAQRVDPASRRPQGMHCEVVLRMAGRDGSLASAVDFLPGAERLKLSSRIDRWVLDRVLANIQAAASPELLELLSVNLSAQALADHAFHRHLVRTLELAGPAVCRKLCLEMTEAAVLRHLADASALITQLHALGVRVALDRCGADGSSAGHLRTLSIDFLKIDGGVIRALLDDRSGELAVRRLVDVASAAGAKTIATCVDRPELLERVFRLGIDFAQGYFAHRPVPIDELLEVPLWELVSTAR